jgi:hypothetical protein
MRAARFGWALACAATLIACSFLVETSELTGNASDAMSSDQATADDGGLAADGVGIEGATPDSATPAGACDADFCESFDEGAVGEDWDQLDTTGGTLAHDGEERRSAPNALKAVVQDASSLTTRTAYLRRALPTSAGVRCEFDILVKGTTSPTHHVDLFQVKSSSPAVTGYSLRLYLRGNTSWLREDLSLADGGCECPKWSTNFNALPRDKWTRVTFETTFSEATIAYDGTTVFKGQIGGLVPSSLGIVIGLSTYDMATYDVRYDDLRCRLLP